MTSVAILQPGYLPWLGFFDQMAAVDIFVYYDDVQYDKHGWRNRNRIKVPGGSAWLTVPVFHTGLDKPLINEVRIDNTRDWSRKHSRTLRQNYARAEHASPYLDELEALLGKGWSMLVDLDLAVIELMRGWLHIRTKTVRSSVLGIHGSQSERLLSICRHLGATRYLSGASAREYLDVGKFEAENIRVEWQDYVHPVYPQQHGPFVPYLSAVDLIFNVGEQGLSLLRQRRAPGEKQ